MTQNIININHWFIHSFVEILVSILALYNGINNACRRDPFDVIVDDFDAVISFSENMFRIEE